MQIRKILIVSPTENYQKKYLQDKLNELKLQKCINYHTITWKAGEANLQISKTANFQHKILLFGFGQSIDIIADELSFEHILLSDIFCWLITRCIKHILLLNNVY